MFSQIWELNEISYAKENIVFLLKTIYIPAKNGHIIDWSKTVQLQLATGYSFH